MKKINKQVAKNKIGYFLEFNKVVLFFHCKNSVSLNKNDNLIDINKINVMFQVHGESVSSKNNAPFNNLFVSNTEKNKQDLIYRKELSTNQKIFKSIVVKNRLAKRAFLESSRRKPLYWLNDKMSLKKSQCFLDSIFQGPILLLGCSNIQMLEKGIQICVEYKDLILLGAFYDKFLINHSQVKRLIVHGNKNQEYISLIYSMKNLFLRPISLMQTLLNMSCFLVLQERLICFLKIRKQQMLVENL